MKKTFKFLGLTLAVLFVLAVIGCEEPDEPVPQSTYVNMTINETVRSVKVEGTFKNSEWSNIYGRFSGLTVNTNPTGASKVDSIYNNSEFITIKVVNYDTDYYVAAGHVITLSLVSVNRVDATNLGAGIAGLINGSSFTKVIDNSRETVRMAFAAVNSKGNAKSI
jgi:hypothetical protein